MILCEISDLVEILIEV